MSVQKKKTGRKNCTSSTATTRTALKQMSTISRLDPRFRKCPDPDPPDMTAYLEALTTASQKKLTDAHQNHYKIFWLIPKNFSTDVKVPTLIHSEFNN